MPDLYLQLTPTDLYEISKKPEQYEAIISELKDKLSPTSWVKLHKFNKGAVQENTVNLALNGELHKARQHEKGKEVVKCTERLQKEKNQRSFNMRQIQEARGDFRAQIAQKAHRKLIMAIPIKNPIEE